MSTVARGSESGDQGTERIQRGPHAGPWQVEVANRDVTESRILVSGASLTIGASPSADLSIEDRTVSSLHVRLRATTDGLEVYDLNSKNGLFIGGARVRSAVLRGTHCGFVIGRTSVSACAVSESDGGASDSDVPGLLGKSLAMRKLRREIRRFADLKAPVLLQGETGSGKDVVARALHHLSSRRGAFVALNAGTLSANLADAELFGHRRGAFTGAVQSRAGAFEAADRGTLFLDEIADLEPAVQVKLLRVIEDGKVSPLGTCEIRDVDVRLVSASWSSLDDRVLAGEFRQDLFHRISTVVLKLPPLRKRISDLPALSAHVLAGLADELGEREITSAALARLMQYPWPGNVRELGSVLYRAAVSSEGKPVIDLKDVEGALPKPGVRRRGGLSCRDARRLLEEYGGNVSAAARAAKVPRTTFRSWLRRSEREADADAEAA